MKRKSVIAILVAMLVMLSTALCWADDANLVIKSTYPENGQENTSMENLGIKMYFEGTFSDENVKAADKKLVKIVDEDGKKVPTDVLFSDKDNGLVLVVADLNDSDYQVKNNHNYTVVISADFKDDSGKTLGKETKISFKTYNQKVNNIVNILMMVVMFGGITFLTVRQNKKKDEDQAEVKEPKQENFNPYKEAKKTGKSVEQVMAEEQKRQEKLAKKKGKKKVDKEPKKKFWCSEYLNNVYHVHAPAPIKKAAKK